jgi:hypothetical protein
VLHVKRTFTFQKLKENVFNFFSHKSNETELNMDKELNTDRTKQEELIPKDLQCVEMLQVIYISSLSVQILFSAPI